MPGDQRRQHVLLLLRESWHVAVIHEIRAVTVISAVSDRKTDLVETRCVGEIASAVVLVDLPRFGGLFEQIESDALDASGMFRIDPMSFAHHAHGAVANILVMDAPEQVVQQTLAQRTARWFHAIDIESPEDRSQDRDTPREHFVSIGAEPGQFEPLHRLRGDDLLAQPLQPVLSDDSATELALAQHFGDRACSPRRTERLCPTE